MEKYDYIICGAGLAGLSLAYRFCNPAFQDKRILVLEKETKQENDRTFCHWSTEEGPYEEIVSKKWSQLKFASLSFQKSFDISPYQYKMIRGDDFYKYNLDKINSTSHIELKKENILTVEDADLAIVKTEEHVYQAEHIFKTFPSTDLDFSKTQNVSQHFMGWFIQTAEPCFNESEASFMDFNIPQNGETRFMYLLPSNNKTALVELAIFSNSLLSDREYETILKNYVEENLNIQKYSIQEKEKGVIPMTTYNFENKNPQTAGKIFRAKYKRYDRTFLNAILTGKTNGEHVFSQMFKKLPPQLIFKFLDEKTSFSEELKVFTAPPTLPFLKAFLEEL